jgi:hypothetical protein
MWRSRWCCAAERPEIHDVDSNFELIYDVSPKRNPHSNRLRNHWTPLFLRGEICPTVLVTGNKSCQARERRCDFICRFKKHDPHGHSSLYMRQSPAACVNYCTSYFLLSPELALVFPPCLRLLVPEASCPLLLGVELRSAVDIALDLKPWFVLVRSCWATVISSLFMTFKLLLPREIGYVEQQLCPWWWRGWAF